MRLKTFFVALSMATMSMAQNAELPYKNPKLTPEQRADDLLSRLTLEEKTKLMLDVSAAVPRLDIAGYQWWNESLHGCARAGLATVFPQAIGMAATFSDDIVKQAFSVASTEQRIKFHNMRRAGLPITRYHGLSVWTPNINIFRDPRWGRGQETYGEDPYLTLRMGVAVVNGLQDKPQNGYDKLHACLKHFAVHSGPESTRHNYDARNISARDLAETYLYAFKRAVCETDVQEVMCAYNRYEGEPCCGSKNLLTQKLRNEWGFDGLVVSDCGAIRDFFTPEPRGHATHENAQTASAAAVVAGTDINCGSSYTALVDAVKNGYLAEADIDRSVRRILVARFRLGEMDPDEIVPWASVSNDDLATEASDALALSIAQQSMTLLQNKGVLPIKLPNRPVTVAVLGPNANDSLTILGNYNGSPRRSSTVLSAIKRMLRPNDKIIYNACSHWVDSTNFVGRYGFCKTTEGKGFSAEYYDGVKFSGAPIAHQYLPTPFNFCTSGATVFAPNVPLSNFSAIYSTKYESVSDEIVTFNIYVCGQGMLVADNDTIVKFHTGHGPRKYQVSRRMKAGHTYDIRLYFAYTQDDAQLNFDLGVLAPTSIPQIVSDVKHADYVVYVGGISPMLEGEEMKVSYAGFSGGDRTDIELPDVQRRTLKALHDAGHKVIFVNMSGSAVGLEPEVATCDAILQAWYGGQQAGNAIADVLWGKYNPAGRLPVTFYKSVSQLPDFEDYSMKGHTYRYMNSEPLFCFGYGMSYTQFEYGKATLNQKANKLDLRKKTTITIPVKNIGKYDGDEVVQLYIRRNDDVEGPCYSLRGFRRLNIVAGSTQKVEFELTDETFQTFDAKSGELLTKPGKYTIYYGPSSDAKTLKTIEVEVIACAEKR
ncbi:MAG: glycoside hydrolase family 3 protein [Bacteroidales bacterium]|nr:glycoside hydrolase family 3 protein [Bacteroidales bacterium]